MAGVKEETRSLIAKAFLCPTIVSQHNYRTHRLKGRAPTPCSRRSIRLRWSRTWVWKWPAGANTEYSVSSTIIAERFEERIATRSASTTKKSTVFYKLDLFYIPFSAILTLYLYQGHCRSLSSNSRIRPGPLEGQRSTLPLMQFSDDIPIKYC